MDHAELANFALQFLDDLRDHETPDVDLIIFVVTDSVGNVAYRTNSSDTDENINALARAIGIETGYYGTEDDS